jgi:hypothetical protein
MNNVPMKLMLSSLLFQRNTTFVHPLIYRNKPKIIHTLSIEKLITLNERIENSKGFAAPKRPLESTARLPNDTSQKKWDDFWSKAIKIEGDQTRRHIIMSSTFKKSIRSLQAYAQQNNLKKELQILYAALLGEYYGCELTEKKLSYLESLMFYTLHNLRFNIFIGCKNWNMSISDALLKIEETEEQTLLQLEKATHTNEINTLIKNWYHQNVLIQQSFKDQQYQNIRIEIQDMIQSMTHFESKNIPIDDLKKDLKERITAITDSLKVDLSQAKNDDIRKWQNSALPLIYSHLTALIEDPDLHKAGDVFKQALQTNQNGALALGISLSQLEAFEEKTVQFFKEAITSHAH